MKMRNISGNEAVEESIRREVARVESLGGSVTIDGKNVKVESDTMPDSVMRKFEERITRILDMNAEDGA